MSFEQIKKLLDEQKGEFHEWKKSNDARLAEIEKTGKADPLLTEKVDKHNEAIEKIQDRIESLQAAMQRGGGEAADKKSHEEKAMELKSVMPGLYEERGLVLEKDGEYRKKFREYLRSGNDMSHPELKALTSDSDPAGGYLITPQMHSIVKTKEFETSPIRQLAQVISISSGSLLIPRDGDEADGGWTSERGTRSETGAPEVGMTTIAVEELYSEPRASQTFLDDSSINVEEWLAGKIAEKHSRIENAAFVSGDGVKKPRGFTTYAHGTSGATIEQIASGNASAITADGVIALFYALKDAYAMNATWAMHRAAVKAVRQLKGSDNNYLWQPGLQAGEAPTLLGRPIARFQDMSSAVTTGNALVMAIADWKRAYMIVDRVGIRILRDPYTAKPFVKFYATKRTGGDVVNFEAIKLMKISA